MMRFMVLEVWWHTYLSLNSLWSIAAAIIQWHKARSYIVRSSMTEWNSPGMMSGSLICTAYEGILTCTRTMVKHDHYRRWCVHSIIHFYGWLFWPTNEPANSGLLLSIQFCHPLWQTSRTYTVKLGSYYNVHTIQGQVHTPVMMHS